MPRYRCNRSKWETWSGEKHMLNTPCKHEPDCAAIQTCRADIQYHFTSVLASKSLHWSLICSKNQALENQLFLNRTVSLPNWTKQRMGDFFLVSGYSFRTLTIIKTVTTQRSWNCNENNINITTVSRWKYFSQFHKCQFKLLFCASIQQLSKW